MLYAYIQLKEDPCIMTAKLLTLFPFSHFSLSCAKVLPQCSGLDLSEALDWQLGDFAVCRLCQKVRKLTSSWYPVRELCLLGQMNCSRRVWQLPRGRARLVWGHQGWLTPSCVQGLILMNLAVTKHWYLIRWKALTPPPPPPQGPALFRPWSASGTCEDLDCQSPRTSYSSSLLATGVCVRLTSELTSYGT